MMMLAAAIIRPVQILIVGQQGMRLSTKEVAIPVQVEALHFFQFEVIQYQMPRRARMTSAPL